MIVMERKNATISVRVPVDARNIWKAIEEIAADDVFTVAALDAACDASRPLILQYLLTLERAGLVVKFAGRGGRYKIARRVSQLPPVRPEQSHLWNAARSLKEFTLDEIYFAATTDDVKISKVSARRYLQRLVDGGYLLTRMLPGSERTIVYRLKPRGNTGPLAPMIVRVIIPFDRNLHGTLVDAVAEELAP